MDQFASEILQRLEACEHELQTARGYIKALEGGLHAIIESHPAPAALASVWEGVLPDLFATHSNETGPFLSALREGVTLQSLSIRRPTPLHDAEV